jgi:hypothetical protein
MKQKYFFTVFIFFLSIGFAAAAPKMAAPKMALILNMEGVVYVKKEASDAWEAAQKSTYLKSGTIITTGVKSFVELKIEDRSGTGQTSLVTINSLSRYMVGEDEDTSTPAASAAAIAQVSGRNINRNALPARSPIGFGNNARIRLLPNDNRVRASMDDNVLVYDFRKSKIPQRSGINVEITWPQKIE